MEHLWEDNLLERKTKNDLKDLLKTMVAFANSVRPCHTAIILIGEKDDGTIQGVPNPDKIQKEVRNIAKNIYPSIEAVTRSRVYEENGKYCVRVEIEYSGETPHFGGPAWVRRGSETVKASDEVFQKLIEYRNGKVREIAKWLGKNIVVHGQGSQAPQRLKGLRNFRLLSVDGHCVTLESDQKKPTSVPLGYITITRHHKNDCLQLNVIFP